MITLKEQNDMISEIEVSIKKLFFTSAIPDMCREAGTPKQIEFLKDALLAISEVQRTDLRSKSDAMLSERTYVTYI